MYHDGQWHMFVSQMEEGTDLRQWKKASFVAHCTAATAAGPYVYRSRAISGYGHNPVLRQDPSGTWLVYFIRKDKGDISLASSSSIYGPWEVQSIFQGGLRITNPSPYIFPNGSVVLAYRSVS